MTLSTSTRPAAVWRSAGPVRLGDLLAGSGLRPFSADGQGSSPPLLEARAHLRFREPVPGRTRYTLVIEQVLDRRGLMDLLFAIAPYKAHGPDDFDGVLDDWRLPDRAAQDGGASLKLLMEHAQALRQHWRRFFRHLRAFAAVLEDRSGGTFLVPAVRWRSDASGARRWDFAFPDEAEAAVLRQGLSLPAELPADPRVFDPLAGFLVVVCLQPELTRRWPRFKPLVPEGKGNFMGPAQVPVLALTRRRSLLRNQVLPAVEAFARLAPPPGQRVSER